MFFWYNILLSLWPEVSIYKNLLLVENFSSFVLRCVRKMNLSSILHVLNILASSFILSPTNNPTCAILWIAWCCGGCLSWCKNTK